MSGNGTYDDLRRAGMTPQQMGAWATAAGD
jgi:hypothetical protein